MSDLDAAIIEVALRKMLSDGHFSICTIDNILRHQGSIPDATAYKRLHLLHCINYKDMPPTVLEALPYLIKAALGGPTLDVSIFSRIIPKTANVVDAMPSIQTKRAFLPWRKS